MHVQVQVHLHQLVPLEITVLSSITLTTWFGSKNLTPKLLLCIKVYNQTQHKHI